MIEVKFKRLHPGAVIPTRATEFAGGWDAVVTEVVYVQQDFYVCKLGFALEVPEGYKVTLVPRSSLTNTRWIMQNSPGLGDPDYRGEYQYRFRGIPSGFTPAWNNGILGPGYASTPGGIQYDPFPFKEGDRIGQLYLEQIIPIRFTEVEELTDTVRAEGGFGSTGN